MLTAKLLGVRKLERLLKTLGISAQSFAKLAGVNRGQLHRIINCLTSKVTVDFAIAVSRASKGYIDVEDFSSLTLYDEDQDAKASSKWAKLVELDRRLSTAAAAGSSRSRVKRSRSRAARAAHLPS
jgi:hypothetical protein